MLDRINGNLFTDFNPTDFQYQTAIDSCGGPKPVTQQIMDALIMWNLEYFPNGKILAILDALSGEQYELTKCVIN